MWRSAPRIIVAVAVAAAGLVAGCGSRGDQVSKSDPTYAGSVLFATRCAGCHTLDQAGTHGSGTNVRDRQRTNGPNFNVRKETVASVLYAVRNGGFSGAIMPQNIVIGQQAVSVAQFLAKYAGRKAIKTISPTPQTTNPAANAPPGSVRPPAGVPAPSGGTGTGHAPAF
ncbi:MAG: c-type cytochrome [Solirubrobacteraceae bacterium]|nr:MAG: hypothetical protein DLM63_07915 [Solirubrobacterales bacterium]